MSLNYDVPDFNLVEGLKFAGVAGVVVLLYDHVLSIEDEVRYIWKARWSAPKVAFLISRYIIPCALLIHIYHVTGLSGVLSNEILLCTVATAPLHFLTILWLWVLWDRNRILIMGTLVFFVLTELAIVATSVYAIVLVTPSIAFNPNHLLCSLTDRGTFPILFIPSLVFESIAFVAVCAKSLRRQRVRHTDIVAHLHRDGILFILIIFMMSVMNFVSTELAPLSAIFLNVGFLLCTITITVTKLVLKLRKLTSHKRDLEDPDSIHFTIPCSPDLCSPS